MQGFVKGLSRYELNVPRESLIAAGIDFQQLLELTDNGTLGRRDELAAWQALIAYPAFASWMAGECEDIRSEWTSQGIPAVRELAALTMPPYRYYLGTKARLASIRVMEAVSGRGPYMRALSATGGAT